MAFSENKELLDNIRKAPIKSPEAQSRIDLKDFLFSAKEINEILTPVDNKFNSDNIELINEKLTQVKGKIVINHKIDVKKYKDVFIMSDTHADLRKVYSILQNSRMIKSKYDPYNNNHIVDPKLISDAKWIPNNTLLIIVGDLIDGCRKEAEVDDPDGSFELKLHMLLYNLRLQAINMDSNIIFTLGNHDCETLNANNQLGDFIHQTSREYFDVEKDISIRKNALTMFYELSPYVFIVLATPAHDNEIVCVHGGLHTKEMPIDRKEIEQLQSAINKGGLNILNKYYKKTHIDSVLNFNNKSISTQGGSLWTRFYADMNEEECSKINKGYDENEYRMIVVGHCPTNTQSFENITSIMHSYPKFYSHCQESNEDNKAGCVVFRCNETPLDNPQTPGAPRIALVDTGLSSSFRQLPRDVSKEEFNNNRPTELLHLCHNDKLSSEYRYYNSISKLLVSPIGTTNYNVYETLSKTELKNKYLKYKQKYMKLKN